MLEGWLIYNREDYEKNEFFAQRLIASGAECGLDIRLVLADEINIGIRYGRLHPPFIRGDVPAGTRGIYKGEHFPDFVINRSRDWLLAGFFEQAGCRVFNTAEAARICNDKIQSHLLAVRLGLPQVDMIICLNVPEELIQHGLGYPVVLKSPYGHGGSEVFMAHCEAELLAAAARLACGRVIIQRLCGRQGEDVRVYVLGGKILSATKRKANGDFRANLSLGGSVEPYEVNAEGQAIVESVLRALPLDYAGIDFLLGENEELLFNELEDTVGSRSLYALGCHDAAALYAGYISQTLGSIKTAGNK